MLIEKLAEFIATKIKDANEEETNSIEMMTHGLTAVLNGLITTIIVLTVGFSLGETPSILLSMCSFALLRHFSGGWHSKTALQCTLFSTFLFTGIVLLPDIPQYSIYICNTIALLLVMVFAPSRLDVHTLIDPKKYPMLKRISIFIVITNYIIGSQVIAITYLAQSILLIKLMRGGEK